MNIFQKKASSAVQATPQSSIRVFFLIRSLGHGGAERQLIELVKGMDKSRFIITVAVFYDDGALGDELKHLPGVEFVSLNKRGRWDFPAFLWRLFLQVHRSQPHIVHGYMGTANELSLLLGKIVGAKVVWGLRVSNLDFSLYDWADAWEFKIGAWLSRFVTLIIVNSHAGLEYHARYGYQSARMHVISNGIDTNRFAPDPAAGQRLRREWNIVADQALIGLVGRLDPQKDHTTFLSAAALLRQEMQNVRFVCVGRGAEEYQQTLQALAGNLGISDSVIWADATNDVRAVYNALDIATSSSAYGEGFSNVIGEAMACGIPCVVTDVGDSGMIVGDASRIVSPARPDALVAAWREILSLPGDCRRDLSAQCRERIRTQFSTQRLVDRTEQLFENIAL